MLQFTENNDLESVFQQKYGAPFLT